MNCPGSVRMSDGIKSKSSVYADEGTAAHMLAEWCLRKSVGGDPTITQPFIGRVIDIHGDSHATQFLKKGSPVVDGRFVVDEEMADAVQLFVDTVLAAYEPGDKIFIEHRVNFSSDDEFGTADCLIYKAAERRVKVFDLKYGAGVLVEVADAEGNPNRQLVCYGEGAVREIFGADMPPIEGVDITIVQPRIPSHPDGPVRKVSIDALQLLDWSFAIDAAVEATHAPDAPLVPGDWCRWCPAAGACPALAQRALAVASTSFDDLDSGVIALPAPDRMSPQQAAKVLDSLDILEEWAKSVRAFRYAEAEAGRGTPGYKIVDKIGRRKWRDEDEAAHAAFAMGVSDADLYTEPKLKSPAQIEKLVGKKDFAATLAALAPSVSSGTALVPVSDKRPEVFPAIENQFEELSDV